MPRGALSAGDLPRNIRDGCQDRQAVPRQVGASVKPVALQGVILLRCGVSDAHPQRAISTYTLWIAGVSITDVSTNSSRRDATNFSLFVRAQGERAGRAHSSGPAHNYFCHLRSGRAPRNFYGGTLIGFTEQISTAKLRHQQVLRTRAQAGDAGILAGLLANWLCLPVFYGEILLHFGF